MTKGGAQNDRGAARLPTKLSGADPRGRRKNKAAGIEFDRTEQAEWSRLLLTRWPELIGLQ